jgi:hypothetical protein
MDFVTILKCQIVVTFEIKIAFWLLTNLPKDFGWWIVESYTVKNKLKLSKYIIET